MKVFIKLNYFWNKLITFEFEIFKSIENDVSGQCLPGVIHLFLETNIKLSDVVHLTDNV